MTQAEMTMDEDIFETTLSLYYFSNHSLSVNDVYAFYLNVYAFGNKWVFFLMFLM